MTLHADRTVSLSIRDWVAILTLVLGLATAVLAAYLQHDRLLIQIANQQQSVNQRLDRIEATLERSRQ